MHLLLRLALLAQMAVALHAGLLLRFEATDHSGSEPQTTMSKMAVEDGKLAFDTQIPTATSEPERTIIYSAANRTMFVVNHPGRIHVKLDEQVFGGLPDTAERMLARMKNLPPPAPRRGGENVARQPGRKPRDGPEEADTRDCFQRRGY